MITIKKLKGMNRIEFLKLWANYVKTHPDEEWSKQQNILIDSQIKACREFLKKNRKAYTLLLKSYR